MAFKGAVGSVPGSDHFDYVPKLQKLRDLLECLTPLLIQFES